MSPLTRSAASASCRYAIATGQPSLANARAVAAPIPREPPVTSAQPPSKRPPPSVGARLRDDAPDECGQHPARAHLHERADSRSVDRKRIRADHLDCEPKQIRSLALDHCAHVGGLAALAREEQRGKVGANRTRPKPLARLLDGAHATSSSSSPMPACMMTSKSSRRTRSAIGSTTSDGPSPDSNVTSKVTSLSLPAAVARHHPSRRLRSPETSLNAMRPWSGSIHSSSIHLRTPSSNWISQAERL